MDRNNARRIAAWLLTIAFELAAGILTQLTQWTLVTILFWVGIVVLIAGYWPDIRERLRDGKVFGLGDIPINGIPIFGEQ